MTVTLYIAKVAQNKNLIQMSPPECQETDSTALVLLEKVQVK